MNHEYVQHRINLVSQWEAHIIKALRYIIKNYNLHNATIKRRKNPWFTEAWCIYALVDTSRIAPVRVRGGIELDVNANTWKHSFQVVSLIEDDIEGSLWVHETCSTLEDALAFILHGGIDSFLDSGDLRARNIKSMFR